MSRIEEALLDSGWNPLHVERRLRIWRLRAQGYTIEQIAIELGKDNLRATPKSIFGDLREVRKLFATIAAHEIEEERELSLARHDDLYTLLREAVRARTAAGAHITPPLARSIVQVLEARDVLTGVRKVEPIAGVLMTPLEKFENDRGVAPGPGPFSAALSGGRPAEEAAPSE